MAEPNENILYEIIQVPEATKVRFFTSVDPGSYVPSHWHRAVEIIYMLEGELEVTVERTSRILLTGQCILINSNVIHSTKCIHPNKAIVLQIPLEFMETYIPEVNQLLFLWNPDTRDPIKRTKLDRMKDTLTQMQIANDIRPEGFLLRFNSLLFELLFQLYHKFQRTGTQTQCESEKQSFKPSGPGAGLHGQELQPAYHHQRNRPGGISAARIFLPFFQKMHGSHLPGIPE